MDSCTNVSSAGSPRRPDPVVKHREVHARLHQLREGGCDAVEGADGRAAVLIQPEGEEEHRRAQRAQPLASHARLLDPFQRLQVVLVVDPPVVLPWALFNRAVRSPRGLVPLLATLG